MSQHCCSDAQTEPGPTSSELAAADNSRRPFPWHLAVYDAHCHPTDTMASIASLDSMRAAAITIMATRSQDQNLVAEVATSRQRGLEEGADRDKDKGGTTANRCTVFPAFGWHPWFSHQLYDDSIGGTTTFEPPSNKHDLGGVERAKKLHYQAVLTTAVDDSFVASLPTPSSLSSFIADTRRRLRACPHALVGEIGLDKAFRLPRPWSPADATSRDENLTPGSREGRSLSAHRVRMQHQQALLRAQLRLAGAEARPVSVHGVQAHGLLYDTISDFWKGHEVRVKSRREKRMAAQGDDVDGQGEDHTNDGDKPYPPRICLHSFSGSVEILRQWMHPSIPAKIFVSFSAAVNADTVSLRCKLPNLVRAVPDDRILVESDLHMAGPKMDAALEDMYRKVCEAKRWVFEEGVEIIGRNFRDFVLGQSAALSKG